MWCCAVRQTRRAVRHPGAPSGRQPVHTLYGGAHLFRADLAPKIGKAALHAFEEYAADPIEMATVLGLPGAATLTMTYGQPWPGGAKDAWTFTAQVTVR